MKLHKKKKIKQYFVQLNTVYQHGMTSERDPISF